MHENLLLIPPTETLRDYLRTEAVDKGVTVRDFIARVDIDSDLLFDTVFGVTPITEETAPALERAFGRPAHFWLNLQKNYDAQASV